VLNDYVLALATRSDGDGVFAGGVFNDINGTNRRGLVKLDINGDRVPGFSARPDGRVNTLARLDNTLYIGGRFAEITGTAIELLAAVDATNGEVLPTLNLDFQGNITTADSPNARQSVDDIDVSSDGKLLVVMGNFAGIDNLNRTRLAVVELEPTASVSTWNSDVYDDQCPTPLPQHIRDIDIAPDNSYFVVGSQGFRERGVPSCSTIVRLDFGDLTNTAVEPTWVNYTGGDSVYEVVSTDHAVYAGGHFRWLNNDALDFGDTKGPGSVDRAGFAALDPLNGLALSNWQSDRNPRGVGVFALVATSEGVYMGDDTDFINGERRPKLKFFPLTDTTITRPEPPELPTDILSADGASLKSTGFDGSTADSATEVQSTGWSDARAALMVAGQLFHADDSGKIWVSAYTDGELGTREAVELYGLTENEWRIKDLSGMFFDHENGRVYYTLNNDTQLYWRGFTPDGRIFGQQQFVAEYQSDILWNDISGMDAIGGHLYFARTDGFLYRAELVNARVIEGTSEQISGPAVDGRRWDNELLAFVSEDLADSTHIGGATGGNSGPNAPDDNTPDGSSPDTDGADTPPHRNNNDERPDSAQGSSGAITPLSILAIALLILLRTTGSAAQRAQRSGRK